MDLHRDREDPVAAGAHEKSETHGIKDRPFFGDRQMPGNIFLGHVMIDQTAYKKSDHDGPKHHPNIFPESTAKTLQCGKKKRRPQQRKRQDDDKKKASLVPRLFLFTSRTAIVCPVFFHRIPVGDCYRDSHIFSSKSL